MSKRFKAKRRSKHHFRNIFIFLIIIYISFNLFYQLIYNLYLSKLTNQEIINHIINNAKNNPNTFLKKVIEPKVIITNNFSLKEQKDESINVSKEENNTIYIYSTHETEAYNDSYFEIYNIKPTVKTVSYILEDYLKDLGISSVVEKRSISDILKAHNWSYKYSYEATKELILDNINTHNYRLIIDLHRDSSSLEKTRLTYNNKNYAKILFVVGGEHPNYTFNYELANTLNEIVKETIPGLSRGISLKSGEGVNGVYNQDINKNMVLIEVGGQYNEIEEVNNTIEVLSRVILKYLERTQ